MMYLYVKDKLHDSLSVHCIYLNVMDMLYDSITVYI